MVKSKIANDVFLAPFCFGTLGQNYNQWRKIGADSVVLSWIKKGYRIPFTRKPRPCFVPSGGMSQEDTKFAREKVQQYLQKGCCSKIFKHEAHCVQRIFVTRAGPKPRVVYDGSPLNENIAKQPFKMETLSTVAQLVRPGDFMTTADLESGYHHLTIHPDHRKYLCFEFEGEIYCWNVLPFGIRCAPYAFTKLLKPVLRHMRGKGNRLNLYIDDFLVLGGKTISECNDAMVTLLELLGNLGWAVAKDKGMFTPTQRVEYLGMVIDTSDVDEGVKVFVPTKKLHKIRHDISRLLRAEKPTKRQLAQVIGQCVSVTRAIVPGRNLLHAAERLKNNAPYWTSTIELTAEVREDLQWWLSGLQRWNGRTMLPKQPTAILTTDASPSGYGGVLRRNNEKLIASEFWKKQESMRSSNARELDAVYRAMLSFKDQVKNQVILVRSDNTTTVSYVNKFGGRWPELDRISRKIVQFSAENGITLSAQHVPGEELVKEGEEGPDALSRRKDRGDWRMHPKLFEKIDFHYGPHTIDRFATAQNAQLPRFNAAYHCPGVEAVDAFSQDWKGEVNYCNPPWNLIHRTLRKIREEGAQATVVAPFWPAQPWWPELLELRDPEFPCPLLLPRSPAMFIPGSPLTPEIVKSPHWRTYAWRLRGRGAPRRERPWMDNGTLNLMSGLASMRAEKSNKHVFQPDRWSHAGEFKKKIEKDSLEVMGVTQSELCGLSEIKSELRVIADLNVWDEWSVKKEKKRIKREKKRSRARTKKSWQPYKRNFFGLEYYDVPVNVIHEDAKEFEELKERKRELKGDPRLSRNRWMTSKLKGFQRLWKSQNERMKRHFAKRSSSSCRQVVNPEDF